MTVHRIEYNGEVYGYVMYSDTNPESTRFYTPNDLPMQMGIVTHKKGYIESPHIHKKQMIIINDITETLHIVKGECQIKFYDNEFNEVGGILLLEGDTIMLLGDKGHQLIATEDFKGIKTKQGPYKSIEEDKIIYDKD